jgi:hypothetical protein
MTFMCQKFRKMSIGNNIAKGIRAMIAMAIIVTAIVTTAIVLLISHFVNSDDAPEAAPKDKVEQTK